MWKTVGKYWYSRLVERTACADVAITQVSLPPRHAYGTYSLYGLWHGPKQMVHSLERFLPCLVHLNCISLACYHSCLLGIFSTFMHVWICALKLLASFRHCLRASLFDCLLVHASLLFCFVSLKILAVCLLAFSVPFRVRSCTLLVFLITSLQAFLLFSTLKSSILTCLFLFSLLSYFSRFPALFSPD